MYVDALHRWTDSDACACMPWFGGLLRRSSAQQTVGQGKQSHAHIYYFFFSRGKGGESIGHKRRKFINFRRLTFLTRNQPLYLDFKVVLCVLLAFVFVSTLKKCRKSGVVPQGREAGGVLEWGVQGCELGSLRGCLRRRAALVATRAAGSAVRADDRDGG